MDFAKIISRLDDYKKELMELRSLHHSQGKEKYYDLHQKVVMVIQRVYPNAKEKTNQILSSFGVAFANPSDSYLQKEYLDDINKLLRAIDTIKEEFNLFGFDDFKPVKEKIETSVGISKDTFGFLRKKTKEK